MVESPLSLGDATEILEKHPKVAIELSNWVKGFHPEESKESITQEHIEFILKLIISGNYRQLYDFFDSRGLFITVQGPQNDSLWVYYSNKENYSETADSRIDAEKKIFVKSFKTLENIL